MAMAELLQHVKEIGKGNYEMIIDFFEYFAYNKHTINQQ